MDSLETSNISLTKNSKPLRIVIVGAGIGGLAAARALRGEGHEITILEQSHLKREIGAAISVGPNAVKILLPWGLDANVSHAVECHGFRIFSHEGVPKITQDLDLRATFGAPWLLFHRVDLHSELRRLATGPGFPGSAATIRTGVQVVDLDAEYGRITLADGETVEGDVIIGADGIHSTLRDFIVGSGNEAIPTGHAMYRVLIPAASISADPSLAVLFQTSSLYIFAAEDRRIVAYWCHDREFLNIGCIVSESNLNPSAVGYEGIGDVEEMRSYYKDFYEPIQKLLRLVTSCGVWQLRDQKPVTSWVKGRTIIVGDAAHAMLPNQGQGAAQAIEDAEGIVHKLYQIASGLPNSAPKALGAYLAHCTSLSQASEIPSILRQVQDVRIARATRIQASSRIAAKLRWTDPGRTGKESAQEQEKPDPNFGLFNFRYQGAKEWAVELGISPPISTN